MFSEFQCPFCARVEPTLEQLKVTYGPEKLRLVWKNQPLSFHANAKPAAEAGQVVFTLGGSTAFFKFHDQAFKDQAHLEPANYRLWAIAAGVDGKAYDKALAAHSADAKIDEDQALAKKVGANGTPSFRINGLELSGAQPVDKFKQVIDSELAKATAKIATGTPKNKIYVAMSTENFAARSGEEDGRRARGGHEHRVARAGPRLAGPWQRRRPGHDHRVRRLPVSVLQAHGADAREGPRHVRRQGPHRVEEHSASVPSARGAGGGARARGARPEG